MSLSPTPADRFARALTDLRIGLPIVIAAEGGRASLALAAEGIDDTRLAEMRGLGTPVLAITRRRAETLAARPYDGDIARLALPADADARWLGAMADPSQDLAHPMKGPFTAVRDGDADIARAAVALAKAAHLLPAALVLPLDAAAPEGLTRLALGEIHPLIGAAPDLLPVATGRVPLSVSEAGRVRVFRPRGGGEEHYAIEIGRPARDLPVLVRLHSACFTGDVLGSLKCDCGPQLHAALAAIAREGEGVLLYLNQEGRGIGLANKLRAYALQDQGFDTVEANHRLGFEDDERDFRIGAAILRDLGFASARLLTNNPAKVAMLEASGIAVSERVPLKAGRGPLNEDYLATKAKKSGHLL